MGHRKAWPSWVGWLSSLCLLSCSWDNRLTWTWPFHFRAEALESKPKHSGALKAFRPLPPVNIPLTNPHEHKSYRKVAYRACVCEYRVGSWIKAINATKYHQSTCYLGGKVIKTKHTWGFARQWACWEQCRCYNHTSIPKAPEECLSHTVHLKVLDEIINNYSFIQRQPSLTRGSFEVGMLGFSFQFSIETTVSAASKVRTGKELKYLRQIQINLHLYLP